MMQNFITHLNVSDALLPESAVLDGFVPLSKLNVFGLRECGDAVVELAIHNLESVIVFCMVVLVVEEEYEAPLLPGTVTLGVWLWFVLICPNRGLGDESGDDVNDETFGMENIRVSKDSALGAFFLPVVSEFPV